MNIRVLPLSVMVGLFVLLAPITKAAFSLVPGDYYTANYFSNVIEQYDPAGHVVGSYTLPAAYGSEFRGLTFGPDNLLYATTITPNGFDVVALDSAGAVQQTYFSTVNISGNISYGKISTDGQYLYVSGSDVLTRFLLGVPTSGTIIYSNNQVFDSKPLPNGNLFVASAYSVQEITPNGALVRTLTLNGPDNLSLNDIRGIEYNPTTNDLFVTELGHTGAFHQLLRFDGTTGALEKNNVFTYGDDMILTASGTLLVGSRTQSPAFFNQDLNFLGVTLQGGQQMFVTQFVVPEPSVVSLIAHALAGTIAFRNFRKIGRLIRHRCVRCS
jgi:hypothetical protein